MNQNNIALLESRRDSALCIYVPTLCAGRFVIFEKGETSDGQDCVEYKTYVLDRDGEPTLELCDEGSVEVEMPYDDMDIVDIIECVLEDASYPSSCPDVDNDDIIAINGLFTEEPY